MTNDHRMIKAPRDLFKAVSSLGDHSQGGLCYLLDNNMSTPVIYVYIIYNALYLSGEQKVANSIVRIVCERNR